jgi:glycosyltransferase involved in cell wall biosynthesis
MGAGVGVAAPEGPLVSVVMPVHNAERFLAEAIESVLAQTYRGCELVLVDDASTDGSWSLAQRYASQDARVRVFRNEPNLGVNKTRIRAFAEANPSSKYFAVMDSDDVCMPDRLERQVAFLETHPEHALVGGNNLIIDERGTEIGRRLYPTTHDQIINVITRYNPIAQPTVTIRRSALETVGVYDEHVICEDYDLWLRMAARFKLANLDAFTLKYRISTTQSKRTRMRAILKSTIEIQRRWLFHPPFFRPYNVLYFGAEHLLLLLPGWLVLRLSERVTYGSRGATSS